MTAIRMPHITVEEYLVRERAAEFKSEYYRGEVFAMAGASPRHNQVKDNLIFELRKRLQHSGCSTYSSGQRVSVESKSVYTYPDIIVYCGTPEFDPKDDHALTNPVAIIEVLSPSTEQYDRGTKFRLMQPLESLKEYVLVAQDEALIDRFTRQADGSWALVSFVGLEATMSFRSMKAEIPLKEIYAGISFDSESGEAP